MITLAARPQLAAKARLRRDPKSAALVLLYPERGLVLNPTAADVAVLLTGELTVAEIIDRLVERYTADRAVIASEVRAFLEELAGRGLLRAA